MASVLIIDDDAASRKAITVVLRAAGHDVRIVPDGRQGVRAFSSQGADLVICELLLAHMDSLDVIGQLRELRPKVPILAITAGSEACLPGQLLTVARSHGVSATLRKPFTSGELLAAVVEAISGCAQTPPIDGIEGLQPKPRPSLGGGDPRTLPAD